MIIKDITAGKKYIAKSGEEKIRWTNIGNLFIKDDGKMVVKINPYINPLAFANEKGEVWFNVFDKTENGIKTENHNSKYSQGPSDEYYPDGEDF